MTREQTIEAIKVMQAFVDGKELEVLSPVRNGCWLKAMTPSWDWLNCNYRIKPTPVLRPWTEDDVPLGAWMRVKDSNCGHRRVLICGTYDELTRSTWLSTSEHSTDGGKTWLPCGVVEEAK
jgi:hypothetical protein